MTTAETELRSILGDEIDMMRGPEATALFKEMAEPIVRKLQDDNYKGAHAVALGAATMTLVLLLKSMTKPNTGTRDRLRAAVIAMLRVDTEGDQ